MSRDTTNKKSQQEHSKVHRLCDFNTGKPDLRHSAVTAASPDVKHLHSLFILTFVVFNF